jgi:hypothetical protein
MKTKRIRDISLSVRHLDTFQQMETNKHTKGKLTERKDFSLIKFCYLS